MGDSPPALPGDRPSAHSRRLFPNAATLLVAVALALRPLASGLVPTEPETAFIGALVWFAALLHLAGGGRVRISRRVTAGLLLFLLPVLLSVWTAGRTGAGQPARDLARVWVTDAALLLLVIDLGRAEARRRLFLSVLLAGAAAVALYALYERFYGMPYFRRVPEGALREGGALAELWNARLRTLRVSGPFGYANALAAFALLLLPLLLGFGTAPARKEWGVLARRAIRLLLLLLAVAAVLSGSKAGLLAMAAVTGGTLVLLLPPERRTGGALLGLAGAWTLMLAGLLAGWALLRGTSGPLADCALGAGWAGAALLLARRARLGRTAPPALGLVVAGVLLLGAGGLGADLARGGPVGSRIRESISAGGLRAEPDDWRHATRAERAERMGSAPSPLYSLVVRLEYWRAALRLVAERPLLGVGLDNFGRHYPRVRPPGAWAVQRAHNTPLQLASDGGLPLLFGWAALWVVLLLLPRARRADGTETDPCLRGPEAASATGAALERRLRRMALGAGLAAFGLIYCLRVYGLFGGLSIEFVLKELFGDVASGAIRARTGSAAPLLVHAGVHLLLLPLGWAAACLATLRLGRVEQRSGWGVWAALGAGGVLLHALADFVTYMPSLHMLLLAVAGLSVAERAAPPEPAPEPAEPAPSGWGPGRLLVTAGVAAICLAVALPHLRNLLARHVAESAAATSRAEGIAADEETVAVADRATQRALHLRPGDPALHRLAAGLAEQRLFRIGARRLRRPPRSGAEVRSSAARAVAADAPEAREAAERILASWRAVTETDPVAAEGWARMARTRLLLSGAPGGAVPTAAEGEARTAVRLAPRRPAYRLLLAEVHLALGEEEAAVRDAREALEADAVATDPQTMLPWEEFVRARRLASRVR